MGLNTATISRIVYDGVPVICLDTCTILDMMRDPRRHDVRPQDVGATLALIAALRRGTVVGLMAEQVQRELDVNLDIVHEEANKSMRELRDQISNIDQIAAYFGAAGGTPLVHFDGHVHRTREAASQLITALTPIPQHNEIANRAFTRLTTGIAPAGRGNGNIKDCVVLETYLDAISTLRGAGFEGRVVFASSNTKDYCDTSRRRLAAEITPQFGRLDIEFASSMSAAKGILGF